MLTESFVASSSSVPNVTSTNSALLKDAGIFIHTYQPQSILRHTFKKSVTAPNCLVLNDTHIFAAQLGKAIVHVYNRDKGNQEATVPFPERIHSLALAANGTILCLGTEGGSLLLWELCTGRQLSTPAAHLQQITCLEVDLTSNFAVSGSADSNLLVWSLLDLLSFSSNDATTQDLRNPRHALEGHRGGITALALGHSTSSVNIAVSTSKDKTAIVWNYQSGEQLKSYLLEQSIPQSLTLDPADRAFYVGYQDGTVQVVAFYDSKATSSVAAIRGGDNANTAAQSPATSLWSSPSQDLGAILSCSLSYDGTTLLTGHDTGKIIAWDIATGQPGAPVANYNGAPITNLTFLRPVGFHEKQQPTQKISSVVKPRPHEPYSSSQGHLTGSYSFQGQFYDQEAELSLLSKDSFKAMLEHPGFPDSLLDEGILELATWQDIPNASFTNTQDHDADFMSLDGASEQDTELSQLREQVAHLKSLQQISNTQIAALTKDLASFKEIDQAKYERHIQRLKKREEKAKHEWYALSANGTRQNKNLKIVTGDEGEDDSNTSESDEMDDLSSEN